MSVFMPIEHYVQYRPSGFDQQAGRQMSLSTVELNTREHDTVEKLGRHLLHVFGIPETPGRQFILRYTKNNLLDKKVLLCDIVTTTKFPRLILNQKVSFVFSYDDPARV